MKSESVLAHVFVPKALRHVNETRVAIPMNAIEMKEPNCPPLVPFTGHCGCRDRCKIKYAIPKEFPHCFPLRTIPIESYYAIQHPKVPPQQKQKSSLPKIQDNETHIPTYCNRWEELLVAERLRLLMLFERYSQYNVELHRRRRAPPTQMNNDEKSATDNSSAVRNWTTFRIEGIADASPPLAIGDRVFIRPLHTAQQTIDNRYQKPQHPPHMMIQQVEIRSAIQSIERKVGGLVHVNWIDGQEEVRMNQAAGQHLYGFANLKYNVRFVPSVRVMEATLSALDWLRSVAAHSEIQTVLFPDKAPSLPTGPSARDILLQAGTVISSLDRLNDQQMSFVNMVINRSLRPSYEDIRGPMICTGPAGTGMWISDLPRVFFLQKQLSLILSCLFLLMNAELLQARREQC